MPDLTLADLNKFLEKNGDKKTLVLLQYYIMCELTLIRKELKSGITITGSIDVDAMPELSVVTQQSSDY